MEHQTLKGLVIRENDFGDQNRYISVLTDDGRRIEILCKGVRRRGARLMNAVRLFCFSEFTVYQGRGGKYGLVDAALIASFWGVTASMETYALCCYLAELVDHMTDTVENSPDAARLFLYALHAVADQKRDRLAVKAAMELRLMAESGYKPDLTDCSVCHHAKPIWFSPSDGVCRCDHCAARLGTSGYFKLLPETYAALMHILTQTIPRVYAFAIRGPARIQMVQVCEAYALYRVERNFESLKFYRSLESEGATSPTFGAKI